MIEPTRTYRSVGSSSCLSEQAVVSSRLLFWRWRGSRVRRGQEPHRGPRVGIA